MQAQKVVKLTPQLVPMPAPGIVKAAPVFAPTPALVVAAVVVAMPVCSNCGAVESVTPILRTAKADGPGLGAVAGGVAGAVPGIQVGNGNGRTAATIRGVMGVGFTGNAVEKIIKKETAYQIGVFMKDGSRRTIEITQAPALGSKVTVEGSSSVTVMVGRIARSLLCATYQLLRFNFLVVLPLPDTWAVNPR